MMLKKKPFLISLIVKWRHRLLFPGQAEMATSGLETATGQPRGTLGTFQILVAEQRMGGGILCSWPPANTTPATSSKNSSEQGARAYLTHQTPTTLEYVLLASTNQS